jgi:hypothetical protein
MFPALAAAQWTESAAQNVQRQSGWEIGLRSGYAFAMGDMDASIKFSDFTAGQIPIQIDLGYRMQSFTFGGYFSYGFGSVAGLTKDLCDLAASDCSTSSVRFGGQVLWSLAAPGAQTVPWLGVGLGYDSVKLKAEGDATISGVELPLQGGLDWRVGQSSFVGLFASFSIGRYTDMKTDEGSASIAETRVHQWLTIGVRANFGG